MEPFTLLIVGGLLVAAIIKFWPWIVTFFSETLVPWIKRRVGVGVGDMILTLIRFADGVICPVRATLRKCYACFKERVLGFKVNYTKTSASTANRQTETFIRDDQGKVSRQVETSEVSWDDLPAEIREEMMRQNTKKAAMDAKTATVEKIKQRAQEQGIVLEEVVTQ